MKTKDFPKQFHILFIHSQSFIKMKLVLENEIKTSIIHKFNNYINDLS